MHSVRDSEKSHFLRHDENAVIHHVRKVVDIRTEVQGSKNTNPFRGKFLPSVYNIVIVYRDLPQSPVHKTKLSVLRNVILFCRGDYKDEQNRVYERPL